MTPSRTLQEGALDQNEIERLLCGGPPKNTDVLSTAELNALFGYTPVKQGVGFTMSSVPQPPPIPIIDPFERRSPAEIIREKLMAGEVLSQIEIENLLNMMTESPEQRAARWERERKEMGETSEEHWQKELRKKSCAHEDLALTGDDVDCDGTPFPRLRKETMKSIQTIHEGVARRFASRASRLLRACFDVKVTCVDQLCYSEFIFGLDNPSYFNVVRANVPNYPSNIVIDINPSIVFPMIDRLLGGGREPMQTARRPLTRIETALAKLVLDMFIDEVRQAYQKKFELKDFNMWIGETESNPQVIQQFAPNETVVCVCFEVNMLEVRGGITICVPLLTFKDWYNEVDD